MKIIFLDIDGVMNSRESLLALRKGTNLKEISDMNPHPHHVNILNHIIDQTGAKVVISSVWRHRNTPFMLWRLLAAYGFKGEVLDKTPRYSDLRRGDEIAIWLNLQQRLHKRYKGDNNLFYRNYQEPIESFVILDDSSDMQELIEFLVQTKSETGLLMEHAEKAIKILNKGK